VSICRACGLGTYGGYCYECASKIAGASTKIRARLLAVRSEATPPSAPAGAEFFKVAPPGGPSEGEA
jgi:hypothetical protein